MEDSQKSVLGPSAVREGFWGYKVRNFSFITVFLLVDEGYQSPPSSCGIMRANQQKKKVSKF
jgi:hypothetical protein